MPRDGAHKPFPGKTAERPTNRNVRLTAITRNPAQ
jgi:hypothetical protein